MSLPKLGKYTQTTDERKRYSINYAKWLDTGETIASASSEVDNATTPPLVVEGLVHDGTTVTFEISGGAHEQSYLAIIKITTSSGEIKQDAIALKVLDYTP